MCSFNKDGWKNLISMLMVASLLLSTGGCAAIIRGTSQTFRVVTHPPGKNVIYQGARVSDGEYITIQKNVDTPRLDAKSGTRPIQVDLHYDPDPLLICDAALLLLWVVPGVVALGVDFGTGAWRDINDPQVIYLQEYVSEESAKEEEQLAVLVASEKRSSDPPPWAPAHGHRAKYRYYYYSPASVYFDVERKVYFHLHSGEWHVSGEPPAGIYIDTNNYVVLEMDTDEPYKFHADVIKRYPPGQFKNLTHAKIKGKTKGK